MDEKKPFYKRLWFIVAVIIFITLGLLGAFDEDEQQTKENNAEEVTEEENNSNETNENEEKSTDTGFGKATSVRNDATGKWKKVVTSKRFEPEDAIEYEEKHMNEGEVHFIVSFATNTTTSIRKDNEIIYLNVTEYEDKEEHDAKKLGSGMLLGEFQIKDGEVIEID